jgi:hypothetical protein
VVTPADFRERNCVPGDAPTAGAACGGRDRRRAPSDVRSRRKPPLRQSASPVDEEGKLGELKTKPGKRGGTSGDGNASNSSYGQSGTPSGASHSTSTAPIATQPWSLFASGGKTMSAIPNGRRMSDTVCGSARWSELHPGCSRSGRAWQPTSILRRLTIRQPKSSLSGTTGRWTGGRLDHENHAGSRLLLEAGSERCRFRRRPPPPMPYANWAACSTPGGCAASRRLGVGARSAVRSAARARATV